MPGCSGGGLATSSAGTGMLGTSPFPPSPAARGRARIIGAELGGDPGSQKCGAERAVRVGVKMGTETL